MGPNLNYGVVDVVLKKEMTCLPNDPHEESASELNLAQVRKRAFMQPWCPLCVCVLTESEWGNLGI